MHDIAAALLSTEHEGVSTYTTRMYSSTFYAQNPALEIVDQQSVNFYLHMYNGNIQHSPLCAESIICLKDLPISARFSPKIFYRDTNSVLLRAYQVPLYSSRLYAQNSVFDIVHQQSVKVYLQMHNENIQ